MFEKGFLQDVRHNLWEILSWWGRRSGLRQLNSGKIYRKVGRADCGNNFSNRSLFTPFIATRFAIHRNHAFAWFRASILRFSVITYWQIPRQGIYWFHQIHTPKGYIRKGVRLWQLIINPNPAAATPQPILQLFPARNLPRRSVPAVVPSTPTVPKQNAGSW